MELTFAAPLICPWFRGGHSSRIGADSRRLSGTQRFPSLPIMRCRLECMLVVVFEQITGIDALLVGSERVGDRIGQEPKSPQQQQQQQHPRFCRLSW